MTVLSFNLRLRSFPLIGWGLKGCGHLCVYLNAKNNIQIYTQVTHNHFEQRSLTVPFLFKRNCFFIFYHFRVFSLSLYFYFFIFVFIFLFLFFIFLKKNVKKEYFRKSLQTVRRGIGTNRTYTHTSSNSGEDFFWYVFNVHLNLSYLQYNIKFILSQGSLLLLMFLSKISQKSVYLFL